MIGIRVLVDADACPVKDLITRLSTVPVVWFSTRAHDLSHLPGWVPVAAGPDAVDHRIVREVRRDDLVVTQDYGLASLVLAKGARALSPSGLIFTAWNIEPLLTERYFAAKARRSGGRVKGPARRTHADDAQFAEAFRRLLASPDEG